MLQYKPESDLSKCQTIEFAKLSGPWPEGVEAGAIKLVSADAAAIIENIDLLINDKAAYEKMAQAKNPYGDGKASAQIADAVSKFLLVE